MGSMLQRLLRFARRRPQTRMAVNAPDQMAQLRQRGTAAAYRRAAGLLLMMELMLWASLTGVELAGRGIWLAAVALVPAGLGVWVVSRWAWGSGKGRPAPSRPGSRGMGRPWELLVLLPCVLLDAAWTLIALMNVLHRLMPSYPLGILRLFVPGVLMLGVLLGRRNGVAYGISLWRWLLPLVAVWVMVLVLRDQGGEQWFPLLGRGWKVTGYAAATGLGALWPAGLLFLLPECSGQTVNGQKARSTVLYVLLPLGLVCLLGLTLASCAAWVAAGNGALGLQLLLPGRSGGSMMLSGLWALVWLIGLMTSFCTLLMAGQKLTQRLWPTCRNWLPVIATALPAAALLWVGQEALAPLMMRLLPWRFALWAAGVVWAALRKIVGKKRRQG